MAVAALLSTFAAMPAVAQTASTAKVVAIGKIEVLPAVAASAARKKISMDRVSQSLDSQLLAALKTTGKFEPVARSDMKALDEEKAATTGAQFDAFASADYALVVTIDDFQDVRQVGNFGEAGVVTKRVLRLSAVGKIYDAKTTKLIKPANFQVLKNIIDEKQSEVGEDGDLSDSILVEMSRDMSEKIAAELIDIGFPARVVDVDGTEVTINRGKGSGIAVGQVWEVFSAGKKIIDPDTGEVLGSREKLVGRVRVTHVFEKLANAQLEGSFTITPPANVRLVKEE
jgi:curli biogenesis system outer membrane secretion channel CsgG